MIATRVLLAVTVLATTLSLPVAPARAAGGLPFGAEAGPSGVSAAGATSRYVTLYTGHDTVLQRVQRSGGRVLAWRALHERLAVPSVALDGTPGGLSADGRTLVLVRPQLRFPIARTRLALADPATLRLRRVTLAGDFTFDAISPDGALLYLVQYVSPRDPRRYAVRAYDTRAHRLLPDAIVDRREPGEAMRGYPLTRATSADGRWSYTLYDGEGKRPFVHALDTSGRRAFCLDLPALDGSQQLYGMHLQLAGRELRVMDHDEPVAIVDTEMLRVVAADSAERRPAANPSDGRDATAWALLGGAVALAVALGALVVTRLRRAAADAPRSAVSGS